MIQYIHKYKSIFIYMYIQFFIYVYIYKKNKQKKKQFATPNNRMYNTKHLKGGVCNIYTFILFLFFYTDYTNNDY